MPVFDPVKDAIESSPVASTQELSPTPSFKHDNLSAAPPSPSRRNSVSSADLSMLFNVSMRLNDGPLPTKRQRTASIHHPLSPNHSLPSSNGGPQIDTGASPGRSIMGPLALPHRSSSAPILVPYAPQRKSAGQRFKAPLTPDEQAAMERACRNTLRATVTAAATPITAPTAVTTTIATATATATHSPHPHPSPSNGPRRRRRRKKGGQGESEPRGADGKDDSHVVIQDRKWRTARQDSPIIGLRNFNNWIKSVLIIKFGYKPLHEGNTHGPNLRRGGKVLELGCGKSADFRKWAKAKIMEYVGIDIADVSIVQARARHNELTAKQRFNAEFYVFDYLSDNINTVVPLHRLRAPFDVVSMQFRMHYAFESLEKVRTVLKNVSQYLRPGGIFLGTIPNSDFLLSRLNQLPEGETSFGNSVYSIRFGSRQEQPLYGHKYWFCLKDAVEDVPEYVARWEEFAALSLEYGLKLIHRSTFHDIFHQERGTTEFGRLLKWMKVVDSSGKTAMPGDQWDAASESLLFF
ncbi:unnamed protein product [Rhizoctonia solani]|uniref:mRNA cap guanine-N(7) methyltransferase n=1 Tax=Rhizoctonia solani TaxID=456999 RepID=A0A8H3HR52_9AGAM|nr:unnamed protein product [Rhizoctonia solani]